MRKCDAYLCFSGYRYAPEQFKAYRVTGFSNGNKNIPMYEQIQLDHEERHACGYALCTKGKDAARAELKRILRKREREQKYYYSVGFKEQGNGKQFAFIRELYNTLDNQQGMLYLYKRVKDAIIKQGCHVATHTMATLDGQYKPENVKEYGFTVDIKKPILIHMV
jgi:hypothetical protein